MHKNVFESGFNSIEVINLLATLKWNVKIVMLYKPFEQCLISTHADMNQLN